MITWTPAARGKLDRYCAAARPSLAASGADATEVLEDLRRHLEQEAVAEGLTVLTDHDVRRLLARIAPALGEAPPPPAVPPPTVTRPPRRRTLVWLALGGVVLPLITLAIELATRMCAATFFDPLPTAWHLLLAGSVPLANAAALRELHAGVTTRLTWLGWANGLAVGIAAFYAALFIPLVLPGILAIAFFGWGLLPLSPLLALIATVGVRRRLRALAAREDGTLPGFWRGLVLALLAVAVLEFPAWSTRIAMQWAIADEPQEQRRGLAWLRAVGSEETLLRECYGRTQGAESMDLAGLVLTGGQRVGTDQARELYYQVTGRPFNYVPAPRVRTARGPFAALEEWTWDSDQGGQQVGGRLRGLTLLSSRLDAVVEPDAALAYFEWILEFKNASPRQQEARGQLLLPPGGVVSRLTLWVNGEEREAAFAGRSQVREAYQDVAIQQRRDPVLVTTAGPDRVLVQCFPVPPNGGVMRVRVGITAPLLLESEAAGVLTWPRFIERNFTLRDELRHALWVEGPGELKPLDSALRGEQPKPGFAAARGQLHDRELMSGAGRVRVARSPEVQQVWTPETRSGQGGFVVAKSGPAASVRPSRLVLVLDGSADCAPAWPLVVSALDALPAGVEVAVLIAADEVVSLGEPAVLDADTRTLLQRRLADFRPLGGRDSLPALVQAWNLAAEKPGGLVVWIHAAQPVLLSSAEPLVQAYVRRPRGPQLLEFQTAPGPNRVLEQLDGIPAVRSFPRSGSVEEDLRRLFVASGGEAPPAGTRTFRREHVDVRPPIQPGDREASPHLARLWAAEEVRRLQAAGKTDAAVRLAADYQIVTPWSGAVVLETQAQYDRHGLQPVDATSVPAIPEPSPRALLLLGTLALLLRRKTRAAGRSSTPRHPHEPTI